MWVYIMASKPYGTLYTGVTSDLVKRIYQHKSKVFPESFTAQHGVNRLVHFEQFEDPENAIMREKAIKKWTRVRKLRLIEKNNPNWHDLYPDLLG